MDPEISGFAGCLTAGFFGLILQGGAAAEPARDDVQPEVTIDATATREPINPLIYAQFIEHLGRCIYGGIWAEMLEDRKFFYPVTANGEAWADDEVGHRKLVGSPWSIVGPADAVTMDANLDWQRAAVPNVLLPGDGNPVGVEQRGLALTAEKKYIGRIVLAGAAAAAPVEMSLVWGDRADEQHTLTIPTLKPGFQTYPFELAAGSTASDGRLRIVGKGVGAFQIAAVSLMPGDNVEGFRRDVLELLRQLNAPMYRWPGGNFVSGYDWRDGLGDSDRRPTRRNPAWSGIEPNDIGIHEFVSFCRLVDAQPLIVVNTGFGDAHSAMQEVEYVNGSPDTEMGRRRVENGHPKPFGVAWWGIGNEMYGAWQLGHMHRDQYVLKHNRFVDKMRAVDPTIRTIAVGSVGEWSEAMLRRCTNRMDLISEHFYIQGIETDIAKHVRRVPDAIRGKAEAHRRYRKQLPELAGKDIRIAMDEWNYWHKPYMPEYGELGCRYYLCDALGIAAGLHEFFRHTDIISMAQYAQTVNVIGCVKATPTDVCFAATGLPLMLYRREFGTLPVAVTGDHAALDLDIAAAWTADRQSLTIGVVNPHDKPRTIRLTIQGTTQPAAGKLFTITGNDGMAYNEPGRAPGVSIHEEDLPYDGRLRVPALSVRLYRLPVR